MLTLVIRMLVALIAAAQALSQTKFEVASIRPNTGPDQGMMVREISGGRFRVENAPLRRLIVDAFGVRGWEITGGPAWTSSARYDITAKAEKPAGPSELWRMLQPLLADRFKMKTHREKKEMPVYELFLVGKGKLAAPREGNCVGTDPRAMPPQPAPGKRLLTACGSILMPVKAGSAELYGGKIRMAALVSRLTDVLGRPVFDQTGYAEAFDLDLSFALDGSLAGMPPAGEPSDPAGVPNIFTAVRQQLGLRLDSTKAAIEVIVIDSIERPTAN